MMNYIKILLILLFVSNSVSADTDCDLWLRKGNSENWEFSWQKSYNFQKNQWIKSASFTFPRDTESQPNEYSSITRKLPHSNSDTCLLTFNYKDNFTADVSGFHFFEVLVDDEKVWSTDVAGGSKEPVSVEVNIGKHLSDEKLSAVTIRAVNSKRVTNFHVDIQISDLRVKREQTEIPLFGMLPVKQLNELPEDLPLGTSEPRGRDWTSSACILQPWGKSQYDLLHNVEGKPENLRDNFGFNAIIVQPPVAYNRGDYTLSQKEFTDALNAYREAGFRIIIYSSIMHQGHGPEWQSGELVKKHPDWVQRDAGGGVISKYGSYWLCPSTPALDYTLEYTKDLVNRYNPDAIMLDNNEFLFSNHKGIGGPTCYCPYCQQEFRKYVSKRFGDKTYKYFGVSPEKVKIPTEKGPLYNLWIHWRNRLWAKANEHFRSNLPGVVFFANTQYLYETFVLATDLQYYHEDVIFSESRSHNNYDMSSKMLLGRALARKSPLWNYLGTFREDNFDLLRKPDEIAGVVGPTLSYIANPWLVYFGFDKHDKQNQPSRDILKEFFFFRDSNPMLFNELNPIAKTATIFSTRARNYQNFPLIPSHVLPALKAGIPLQGIHDENLKDTNLNDFKTIIAEHVTCLSLDEYKRISNWLQAGGTLVTTRDFGLYDQIGRPRRKPLLTRLPEDNDRVIIVEPNELLQSLIAVDDNQFYVKHGAGKTVDIEVRPYISKSGFYVLHLVNHTGKTFNDCRLKLPESVAKSAKSGRYFSFEKYTTIQLDSPKSNGYMKIPDIEYYGILVLYK